MNKIFKVVWSKTKECYVVVSEVAKNNGGKKKALSTVFAALIAAGAMMPGQVDAVSYGAGGGTASGDTSIAIGGGFGATQAGPKANSKFSIAIGQEANATGDASIAMGHLAKTSGEESAIAIGNETEALSKDTTAVGSGSKSQGEKAAAFGFQSKALASYATALGSGALSQAEDSQAIGRQAETSTSSFRGIAVGTLAKVDGIYGVAVGATSKATAESAVAVGYNTQATGYQSAAVGPLSKATNRKSTALGVSNTSSGVASVATGAANTASGDYAAAYGAGNTASGEGSFAAGYKATATNKGSVAIGQYVNTEVGGTSTSPSFTPKNNGDYSTAVGYNSIASSENSAAYGAGAQATNKKATAVGNASVASGENSSAFGYNNTVTGDSSTALGTGNVIDNGGNSVAGAVAVGNKNKASGDRAIAIGETNTSKVNDTITMGTSNTANTAGGIAIGKNNTADSTAGGGSSAGNIQIAIGSDNQAKNEDTIAIGRENTADKRLAMAIGNRTEATGIGAVAIGSNGAGQKSISSGSFSVALGTGTNSTGTASTALGGRSQATADSATAVGREANASAESATALGYKAAASIKDGVALGSESKTTVDAGQVGYNPAAGRTNKYDNLTDNKNNVLTSNRAAVAIGDDDAHITRQLTGLAAGTKDTDAVNVAQLRAVNLKYAGNSGDSDVRLENGTLNIKGEGLLSTSADGTGITVKLTKGDDIAKDNGKAKEPTNNGVATTQNVVQAINNSYWKATAGGNTDGTPSVGNVKPGTQVTYSAGDNLKVKQTIAANGDQEYTYSLNPVLTGITSIANTAGGPTMTFGGNSINITGGSLNMGNSKITNLAPGTDDKDAVNLKQLKDTEIHITPGTYTPDSNKKVTLTYENGDNKTVAGKTAVIDLSGLATGGTASTEKVQKAADATGDKNIADVNPKAGDTFGDAGATYEVSVSRNAVKDAAREAVTVNNGGTTTGGTYTADTNNPISVTATSDNTKHNTTYAVTFDGNKAAKLIPLTYKANNAGAKTVTLDKGLDFTNGTNTTAEIGNDGVVKYNLNKDVDLSNNGSLTVGDTKVTNGGVTIKAPTGGTTTNVTLTNTGLDNGGNKIINVKDGDVNATSKDAVNGSQLHAVAAKERHIAPTTATHAAYTVDSNGDVTLDYVDGDGAATSEKAVIKGVAKQDLSNITNAGKQVITGLSNKVVAGDNITVDETEDTTTKQKTYKVNAKLAKLEDGTNTTVTGDGTTGNAYHVNVAGDLTGISSITNGGTNNGKISFGSNNTVTVDGDHSITLNASTGKIGGLQNLTFDPTNITSGQAATEDQLKSVHDTLKANELHIAPTESNRTGEHLGGTASGNTAAGAAAQAYKYNATTKQVVLEYNDGTGANKTGTKAVIDLSNLPTGGDMSSFKVTSSAESATVGTHAGDTEKEIKNGKSVDFQAGKNMTVKQTNDGNGNTTINYALNKDLDVESVHVGKDGKDGKIGIDGKDGVDGLNGTNRVDIHVEKGAKGVDGTDGHDGVNGHNGKDGMTRIVYEDKGGKQEVATLNDGMKYAGDDAQGTDKTKVIAKKLNETLDIIGGANKADLTTDNIGVNNDGNGKLLVQLSKKLKGLDSVQTKTVELGDHTTPGGTTNITYNTGDKRIEYTTPGATAGSTETKKVATTDDIWTIQGNGTDVAPVNGKVNVKAGDNVVIKTPTTADGSMTISAVTSAVYTKADGTKVYKIIDPTTGAVTWNTKADGTGTPVNASDVILSFQDAAGNTTGGGSIVNNVGSAIDKTGSSTGDTFLSNLNTAATNTPNAAVNVRDLKTTSDAIIDKGLKFDANVGGVKTNKLGSTVKVQGAGTGADANYSGTNIKTFISQTGDDTTIDVKLDKNLTGINSITGDTNSGKLVFQDPNATGNNGDAFKFTGGNINAGNNNITNLKSGIVNNNGSDDTNGANIGDVKKIAKDTDLHIAPTAGTTNNVAEYTVDANNKVTLTYQDGNGTAQTGPKAVIDLSALANKITSGYTFNTNAIAKGGAVDGSASVKAVDNGGTINYAAGKNLTVKQEIDTTNKTQTYTYSLDKDISVENITVTGQNGKDGSIGINGKDGVTRNITVEVPGQAGQPGTPGVDGTTTTRIVFDGKAQANLDDGMKYAGDDAQGTDKTKVIAKKLNETLDIIGGANKADLTTDNIGVNNDGNGKLLVQLSKKLKGLDSVQTKTVELGDHTTPGGTTNITYNTGDKRIEYTTPGATAGSTETKKVATTDDIWTIQGNGTDVAPVNGKVNVKAGDNVVIKTPTTADGSMTISAVTSAVYTKADGTKVYKIIDPTTGAVTWNTKADGTGTPVVASDVIVSFQDAAGNTTGGGSIVNNVGSAIDKTGTSTGNAFLTKLDTAANATPNAAVNVKDLKNTSDALINKGLNFTGNNDATVNAHKLGSLVKVQGEGVTAAQVAGFQSAAGNIAVVANSTDTLEIKLNKNLKGINSVSNGSSSITLNSNPGGTNNTPAVQITGGNLSMGDGTTTGNNKIVNLAPGTDDNDAVNVKQLKAAKTVVEAGTNVTVNKTTGANGEDVYTVSATGGGTGTASSWNVKSTGNTDPTSETAAKNISDGKTVEMAAGKNLTVKQTSDANGAKVEFALNKDLTNLDKIVVNGNDGATGQAGVSIVGPKGANGVDGNDGKVGIAGKDGKDAVSISGKDGVGHIGLNGKDGANGISADIVVEKGKAGVDGKDGVDGITRIIYKDQDNNSHQVATHDDGMKFAGDDGQANQDTNPNVIKKHLNNVVDIIGGADKNKLTDNNIGVNNVNGKLKVQLSKEIDLTPDGKLMIGATTVNKNGVTIANGPSITTNGVDAGNKKITNVADGAVNATSKDAVNGSQLYQAMQDAKTHLDHGQNTTVSGTGTQADPYKVNVQGDLNKISSITNNAGDGKVKFDPNQTVTVAGDHNISLNGKTGDITGLTNTSIGGTDFATKGRAATEEQLKEAMNSSVEKVKKAADGANDKNIAEVNPTGGATNYGKAGTTYEVSVSRNAVENNARLSYTHNGNPSKQVTLSEGLNFKNGTNTTARTEPNGQVFYDVNPNLQNISSISGSTTGNGPRISFNNAGSNSTVQIEGGNLDMSDHKIVRLTPGTNATDAATVGQLTKINSTSTVIAKNVGTEAAPVYELTALAGGTVDNTEVNMRIDQLGEEIGRVGAQGAALSALKPIQYDPLEPTQIMAGYGNYRGNSALALGVAHYKNESTLIHGGVSWAGGSSHMMANAGVTWKVGNRDSEAAVADRYRKGPISSAYAMQQEMAAMKAQNAGLKGEVSDLKAENEQMKAQIAAMMAKLGL